jgi:hypothetical protein
MTDIDRIPPARAMARGRRDALREALEAEVRGTRPWWRRSWQGLAVGGGALALVLAGGAATAYVAFMPAEDRASVLCYSQPDLDSDNVPGIRVAVGRNMPAGAKESDSGTVPIGDPAEACAQAWQDGQISADGAREVPEDSTARYQVPDLVACTLDEGVAGVFPGSPSTCERLGLPQTTR